MSTAMSAPKLTDTVGFYNGNKWPIHLVISELNITLHLKPGEYILDKQGRKINDAYFNKYALPLQLTKERAKNGTVELIEIPKIGKAPRPAQAVTSVTEFTPDRRPIMPVAKPELPGQSVSTPTHRGMSVEEARRAGFIGKPLEVPEDYGITDTAGRPVDVGSVPPIKYAVESTPRVRHAAELPPELVQVDAKLDAQQARDRASLVSGLSKASAEPDGSTGFLNKSTVHAPVVDNIPPAPARHTPKLEESDDTLPAPDIFAPSQVASPAPAPEPVPKIKNEPVPKTVKPFICSADSTAYRYRSQLEAHAKRKFPDQVAEIMANYPKTD